MLSVPVSGKWAKRDADGVMMECNAVKADVKALTIKINTLRGMPG